MFERLKQRYERNFVTKNQLLRYMHLGKITKEEYEKIVEEKEF